MRKLNDNNLRDKLRKFKQLQISVIYRLHAQIISTVLFELENCLFSKLIVLRNIISILTSSGIVSTFDEWLAKPILE